MRASLYRIWGRVGVCPGVGLRDGLSGLLTALFVVLRAGGGMHSTLHLLPTLHFCSWLLRNGSWIFFPFLSFWSRICPNGARTQLFFVPYSFCVFCCSRRAVSRCKHCGTAAKCPRSQACLTLATMCRSFLANA